MPDLREQNIGIDLAESIENEEPLASLGGSASKKSFFWKAVPLATKGGLAVLDQGLISGSNFLVGILLARWLAPAEYGAAPFLRIPIFIV
jgi:hypothetical protein